MKKLILILLAAFVAFAASSQVVGQFSAFVNDTTTNTETVYLAPATPVAIVGNYTTSIWLGGTNASGTATVSASLQLSDNGTTWYNYGTAITLNNAGTVSNYVWVLSETAARYYRVRCISSGTGVTYLTGKIGLKRK